MCAIRILNVIWEDKNNLLVNQNIYEKTGRPHLKPSKNINRMPQIGTASCSGDQRGHMDRILGKSDAERVRSRGVRGQG